MIPHQAGAGIKECMMSHDRRLSWMGLKSWQAGHRTWRRDQRDKRVRPTLTLLEERTLLSTLNLTVTTLADDPVTPISEQTTLRDAITQANADTTDSQEVISFAVTGTIDLTSVLPDLVNNISIQGPGASNLTVKRVSSAPDFSVFTVDSGETVSLSGMTIAGGNATSTMGLGDISGEGGGIYNAGALTVTNSTFTGNSASIGNGGGNTGGGGIYNAGALTVTNSTFTNNSAPLGNGGGIDNFGTLTVTGSTFTGNSANGGGWGGGILNAAAMTVTDSTFTSNSAGWGGGIFNSYSSSYQTGTVTVNGSTFTSNSAAGWGGGVANNNGMLAVTNSTFTSNSSGDGGGGTYNNVGMLAVTNSTFTSNSAIIGGGICNSGYLNIASGTATVTNCTIDGNSGQGGGVYNFGTLTLNNTIVAGNTNDDIWGQVTSAYNNLIGNGVGITNLAQLDSSNLIGTTADPLNPGLGPLANNGGPTQTMALLRGSPAINAGSNALAVDANLTTDQRGAGFPRIVGGTVDIGAYESPFINQTISFGPLANQTYGVAPITLTATAT